MPAIINSDNGVVSGSAGLKTSGANDGILALQNNGTTNVTVTAAGNVGVGTASPGSKLDVNGSFYQYNAYALLGNFNAGISGVSPSGNAGLAVSGNISNGQAETDIWNTNDPALYANTGLLFTQRLTSSTRRDLMFLHNNGNLQFNSGYGSVATAYGCRAWVNFNGTGTVAIRASGNVTSITDNGTGDYTVNFTTAMPDANYAGIIGPQAINAFGVDNSFTWYAGSQTTTSIRVAVETITAGYTPVDAANVTVAIFR